MWTPKDASSVPLKERSREHLTRHRIHFSLAIIMGARSKIKKTRKSIVMINKGKSSCYYLFAALGICIACLPLLIVAQLDETLVVGANYPPFEPDDLEAAESQNIAVVAPPQGARMSMPAPSIPIPASAPAPSVASAQPQQQQQRPFAIPKSDLASAPSYSPVPRYAVPPVNPYRERLPYEVASFRRRAHDEDVGPPQVEDDDYKPSESKGKKHGPSITKRVRNSIRNTGKAIVGAPSYIFKRYRGTWKKLFGGGKKKKGWKSWSSSSDKADGWGSGWEETEPTSGGGWDYPAEKGGWKPSSSKGWAPSKGWDSNERRYDREPSTYRERERDDDYYDRASKPRERQRYSTNYREDTHYDDYDGRRTTASYGPSSRKSSRRPSSSGGGSSYRQYDKQYDDDY